jgi:hypothetical protein
MAKGINWQTTSTKIIRGRKRHRGVPSAKTTKKRMMIHLLQSILRLFILNLLELGKILQITERFELMLHESMAFYRCGYSGGKTMFEKSTKRPP